MSILGSVLGVASALPILVVCRMAARETEEIMRRAGFPTDPPTRARRWRRQRRA